jgi:hypothetical protein
MRAPSKAQLLALAALSLLLLLLLLARRRAGAVVATPDLTVLQTGVRGLTPEVLREGRPVVVQDRLVRPEDLLPTCFRWQFWRRRPRRDRDDRPGTSRRNGSKFLLVFNQERDAAVDLFAAFGLHMGSPRAAAGLGGVRVLLRRHQVLVVPRGWGVACPQGCSEVALD